MCSKKSLWTTELDIIKIRLDSCEASTTIPSLHMEKPRLRVVEWLAKVQSWKGQGQEVELCHGTMTSRLPFLLLRLPLESRNLGIQILQGQEGNSCLHSLTKEAEMTR